MIHGDYGGLIIPKCPLLMTAPSGHDKHFAMEQMGP